MSQGLPDITKYVGGQNNSIFGIAYSNDATRIATMQLTGPVNIFDAATGNLRRVLPVGGTQASFTPNDEKLIIGGTTGFWVFDAETGSQLNEVKIPNPYTTNVKAGAISADGTMAAAVVSDLTAIVWDLTSGESKHTFTTPGISATSATFTPSGDLAVGNTAGQIVVYDPTDGSIVRTINAHSGFVNSLDVTGNVMVSGGGDSRVKTWNADTGTLIRQFQGHSGAVYYARMSPNGQYIASGGMNGQFYLWNANANLICAFWNSQGSVRGIAFSPNSEEVVGGDQMRNVNHWRINGLILKRNLTHHKGDVDEVAVSKDRHTAVTVGHDGVAKVWRNGQLERNITFGPQIYSADISPNGNYLALGGGVMTYIYNIDTGAQMGTTFHSGVSMGARFWRDSQSVFSSCTGHELKRVALNGSQMWLIHLEGPVLYVAIPTEGNYVAAATLHQNSTTVWTKVTIVDISNGQVVRSWTAHTDYVRGFEFAPDGNLVTAFFDGTIRSWNPDTGASVWSRTTPGGIESMALNRIGDVIMTGEHASLRMFKVSNGAQLKLYDEQIPDAVNSVKFSPDERWFIYGLDTGTFAVARSPFDAGVESAQLVRGASMAGGFASLNERDGDYWRLRPGTVLSSSMPPIEVVALGTAPSATASRLSFTAVLGASATALEQKVALFNYQTNTWEVVDTRSASVTDQQVTIDMSNAARFIAPLTREIRARFTWKQTGPVLAFPWQARIDQAYWTVIP
jgi:WD40 repeat protein